MPKTIVLAGVLLAASPLAAVRSKPVARSGDEAPARLRAAAPALLPLADTSLIVSYEAFSCPCAKWATRPEEEEPHQRGHIYLEPATARLPVAETFWDGRQLPLRLQVTGHFVSQSGYPKGYSFHKGQPEPAPVFRYRTIKVLRTKRGR